MAQRNSTLIHENAELSLDLSHYSPISVMLEREEHEHGTDEYDVDVNYCKKSINSSSKTINAQMGDELPIWIGGDPFYVSGVTECTTCNEIIEALIDDELKSYGKDVAALRDLNDFVITEKWRDVEQVLPGDTKILPIYAAWGHAQNEVKFKLKIDKNKAGTNITDDADVCRELKKQRKKLKNRKVLALAETLRRLFHQGEAIKNELSRMKDHGNPILNSTEVDENILLNSYLYDTFAKANDELNRCNWELKQLSLFETKNETILTSTPDDELFLIIDDQQNDDGEAHVEYRQYYLNQKLNRAIEAKNYPNESTPKKKSISKRMDFDALRQNSLNTRLMKYFCAHNKYADFNDGVEGASFGLVCEINSEMTEITKLMAYEEFLTQRLTSKCEEYHRQNNKYVSKKCFELRADELQKLLDHCAKRIIETELELQKVKEQIHTKCSILYKLQKLLDVRKKKKFIDLNMSHNNDKKTFSDSINNKTMII